ncbi:hypothetical protein C4K68_16360 [Pokkaliibacter plantistimulans]|uniref:Divergent polysaccharide deacetylase family protein n=1 Tax=Proteobacteria bacterium 228 TaxID=2083153 RepID=A0A2S5KN93_9PROT|nr:divergent polysaccharide deacetylase family protein [Pokkaliibacter plantistimulans]PPC76210.1 hypothetical protein C4K68_16360 [Pokkaliibacter plantistimulans]
MIAFEIQGKTAKGHWLALSLALACGTSAASITPLPNDSTTEPPAATLAAPTKLTPPSWPRPIPAGQQHPVLVLIIDDMGQSLERGTAALNLPGPMTFAFLPGTPHARELAINAKRKGHGVILHAPMANQHNFPLGPGGLTLQQSREQLESTLNADIAEIPGVEGVNNHMGSLLTEQPQQMSWVMDTLKPHGLYFLDSRTTAKSVATAAAVKHQVPWLQRDVFLDDSQKTRDIEKQLDQALELAKKRGYAVAIGHPYPTTLEVLKRRLPEIDKAGYRQLSTTQLLVWLEPGKHNIPTPTRIASATEPAPAPVSPPSISVTEPLNLPAPTNCQGWRDVHYATRLRGKRLSCHWQEQAPETLDSGLQATSGSTSESSKAADHRSENSADKAVVAPAINPFPAPAASAQSKEVKELDVKAQ